MSTPGSDHSVPAGAEPDVPADTASPAPRATPPAPGVPAGAEAGSPPAGAESPAGSELPAGAEAPAGAEVPAGAEAPVVAPGPRRPLSNAQRIAVVAAVGVAAVGIGGGVVYASSHQSADSAQGGGGMRVFRQGGNDGLSNALHGEYVASDGKGGTTTMLLQTGTVTAVSSGSLSLKSTDGFTGTYTVGSSTKVDEGSDTIGKVKTGHTVTVVATKSNRTATSVLDTTLLGTNGGGPQNNTGNQQGTTNQQGTGNTGQGNTGQGNGRPGGGMPAGGMPGGAGR